MDGACRWAWSGDGAAFGALDGQALDEAGLRAGVPALQHAMRRVPEAATWWVVLGLRLLRLRRRVDAVLVSDRAVVAIQMRAGPGFRAADRLEAEDAALDLADFHAGCRGMPVLPVLLGLGGGAVRQQFPLPLSGAAPAIDATRLTLPGLLQEVARFPRLGRCAGDWIGAGYAPVPGLLEAACMLYGNHDLEALRQAGAGPDGLRRTGMAVAAAVDEARRDGAKAVVFVTGVPGAGKTLCGLDLAFTRGREAAFLTGNPTLVHVLREALVRDAVGRGVERHAAARLVAAVIQELPRFRDHYAGRAAAPPERLIVVDEAQRCWSAAHAVSKTRNRAVTLTDSEPGHLLDAMERLPGWGVLVCLVGGGQEIHDGEGGLASWGEALRGRPAWRGWAPPDALEAADLRQRLPALAGLRTVPELYLARPVRAVGADATTDWVSAVLDDRADRAAAIAREAGGVPFAVTRSLASLRAALLVRGTRSAGLLASSTARRLRAEGLGAVLPHQDEGAVARWFLDRWPDIRSSDALEVVASEFAVQGLELDRAGVCWDLDLVRGAGGWEARRFRGSAWTRAGAEAQSNRVNAYRVLLTRARHGTVIWVPRGDRRDRTRDPDLYDSMAAFLRACGAAQLDEEGAVANDAAHVLEPALLVIRLLLAFLLLAAGPAAARELKVATWNLEWLTLRPRGDPVLPEDVVPKGAADWALLRRYTAALDADVVAFQEVDGPEAAAQVFPPDRYALFFTHDRVVQRVGFAVRRGIAVQQNPDLVALDVQPEARFPLRSGADITLVFPGARLRLLGVHLKSGCHDRPLDRGRACTTLGLQIAPLQGWVAQRRAEGAPFAVLGDFNRVMDGGDELEADLERAAPLLRVTAGRATPCWGGNTFIDHILLGGAARAWLEPNSMRVLVYREGPEFKDRLSDHCPVSVRLRLPD